ncbi:hypothetical protein Ait01nite_100890 [Actinoplanes italicus]|nr:hypothetical protein Ait01nite_100890 [Actinoplanes italicus]
MNIRVPSVPPFAGGEVRHILGTVDALTSPRPITSPASIRSSSTRRHGRPSADALSESLPALETGTIWADLNTAAPGLRNGSPPSAVGGRGSSTLP